MCARKHLAAWRRILKTSTHNIFTTPFFPERKMPFFSLCWCIHLINCCTRFNSLFVSTPRATPCGRSQTQQKVRPRPDSRLSHFGLVEARVADGGLFGDTFVLLYYRQRGNQARKQPVFGIGYVVLEAVVSTIDACS